MDRCLTEEELLESNYEQMKEMEVHKYLESQKAGRDLGKAAYMDWIMKHAKAWREHWMHRHFSDDINRNENKAG